MQQARGDVASEFEEDVGKPVELHDGRAGNRRQFMFLRLVLRVALQVRGQFPENKFLEDTGHGTFNNPDQ